jgi:hypothetical protein
MPTKLSGALVRGACFAALSLWLAVPQDVLPAAGTATTSATTATTAASSPTTKPVDLLAGAKWAYGTDWAHWVEQTQPSDTGWTLAQATFTVNADDLAGATALELVPDSWLKVYPKLINGRAIPRPMAGMYYKTIPAIPVSLVKPGANTLVIDVQSPTLPPEPSASGPASEPTSGPAGPFVLGMHLNVLKPIHLCFKTGPILGAFDDKQFTVTCRTNIPATVTLDATLDGSASRMGYGIAEGTSDLVHRFTLDMTQLNDGKGSSTYHLTAHCGGFSVTTADFAVPRPGPAGKLRFAAAGDSKTYPEVWAKVAAAIAKANPQFIVFNGDMTHSGVDEWWWDDMFFGPSDNLFARIPVYPTLGNHEDKSPLYDLLFHTPSPDGKAANWAQAFGDVLVMGVDGELDWSTTTDNYQWAEKTLAESKAKFIFFVTHYPGWSAGRHGKIDAAGRPVEQPACDVRDYIYPLLVKYHATCLITSHTHCYERSELPGLTQITTAGAGASLNVMDEDGKKWNPYMKVYEAEYHFCLFEIDGDTCKLTALTPDGKVLDTKEWKARGK